jgi:hypothetical protein
MAMSMISGKLSTTLSPFGSSPPPIPGRRKTRLQRIIGDKIRNRAEDMKLGVFAITVHPPHDLIE